MATRKISCSDEVEKEEEEQKNGKPEEEQVPGEPRNVGGQSLTARHGVATRRVRWSDEIVDLEKEEQKNGKPEAKQVPGEPRHEEQEEPDRAKPEADARDMQSALQEMQKLKSRARGNLEEVRWRRTCPLRADMSFARRMQSIKVRLCSIAKENKLGNHTCLAEFTCADGSPENCAAWLTQMSHEALAVTYLKASGPVADELRRSYAALFRRLPELTIQYLGQDPQDLMVRAQAITQLVVLHRGEVVELAPFGKNVTPTLSGWTLRESQEAGMSKFEHPQFHCRPAVGESDEEAQIERDAEYGAPLFMDGHLAITEQAKAAARQQGSDALPKDFAPDFARQTNRLMVPCFRASTHTWYRTGCVMSLGGLFMALGKEFDAADLYQYYSLLRIVAVKKRPPNRKKGGRARH